MRDATHVFPNARFLVDPTDEKCDLHRSWHAYDEHRIDYGTRRDIVVGEERMDFGRLWTRCMGRRPAVLVGFSQGARFALRFAVAHPRRVSHLVLLSPACTPDELRDAERLALARELPPAVVVGGRNDESTTFASVTEIADRIGAPLVAHDGAHRVVLAAHVRNAIFDAIGARAHPDRQTRATR